MTALRFLSGWTLLLALVGCGSASESSEGDEAQGAIVDRLAATEERLGAIESKLDALSATLERTNEALEPVATWAEQRKAQDEAREERRRQRESVLDPLRSGRSTDESGPVGRELEGAAEGIQCEGLDTARVECKVDRAFVDHLLANPALLARQARIVPSQRSGSVVGYKFYGIRPGSLPKLLGFHNGDMITAVNGTALTSIDKAMDLYTELRGATRLELSLERKGSPLKLVIELVE